MDTATQQPSLVAVPLLRVRSVFRAMLRTLPAMAAGAIALYALDAWVIRPSQSGNLLQRVLLAGAVAVVSLEVAGYGWRLSSPVRSLGMLMFGIGGLTIIGPIVGSYISKNGLHGPRYTGLLAVAGSLVLIGSASRQLVAGWKSWRKLLSIPIALVTLQFVMWPLGNAVYTTNAALAWATESHSGRRRPALPERQHHS